MPTALFLIVLGAAFRLLPHPPNAVPMAALALYAGARLPRRWAVVVPLAAMALADLVLDRRYDSWGWDLGRALNYGAFALIVALGCLPRRDAGPATRLGMGLLGSALFFVISNFGVWATGGGFGFPRTGAGLVACYTVAWPFFYPNAILADLIGTAAFFGLDALSERALKAHKARAARLAGLD